MEVIYVDRFFVLNLVIDYLLCLCSARVCGLLLRRWRYALASLIGAVYAVAALLPGCAFLASGAGLLAAAALMAAVAFGGQAHFLRCGAVFLCVAAAFGGGLWALSSAGRYPIFDMRVLLLSFAFCYAGLQLLFRARAKLPDQPRCEVRLVYRGRACCFPALVDTGNRLCDPMSGAEVLLACPRALAPLFPGLRLSQDPVSLAAEGAGFRLIPYRAVGGEGLLPVFRPERVEVGGRVRELIVAVSPGAQGDGFEGIAHCMNEAPSAKKGRLYAL